MISNGAMSRHAGTKRLVVMIFMTLMVDDSVDDSLPFFTFSLIGLVPLKYNPIDNDLAMS